MWYKLWISGLSFTARALALESVHLFSVHSSAPGLLGHLELVAPSLCSSMLQLLSRDGDAAHHFDGVYKYLKLHWL